MNAQEGYRRAVINARIGGYSDVGMVNLLLKYGRASGVICKWEEADKGLNEAHEISNKLNGDMYIASRDLGLLKSKQGKYEKAVKYYKQAITEMESKNHNISDAYRYAVTLKEYASNLDKLGNPSESKIKSSKSEEILKEAQKTEVYTTPFGVGCNTP